MAPAPGDESTSASASAAEMEPAYEDYFNPTWFNDEPFVEEVFRYGQTEIVLCGLSWTTVQAGAGYSRIGHTLWAAANFLAEYLYHHPETVKGKHILEVGCGLGLTGLVASNITDDPSDVVLTDGDQNILDALHRNIDKNFPANTLTKTGNQVHCGQPVCAVLSWGDGVEFFKKSYGQFDLILGADVLYSRNYLEPLITTLCSLLNSKNDSRILLAFQTQYGVHFKKDFLTIASEHKLIGKQLEWTTSEIKLLKSTQVSNSLELWEFAWKNNMNNV